MKILVTGAAGFIGHTLVLSLLSDGHEVVGLDNVNDYYDPNLKEARIKRFSNSVEFYRIDLLDFEAMDKVFASHKFDVVCHLAAQAGVRYSLEHPEVYVASNYVGTFNIFELAKKHQVKQVLFASTSSVYGTSTRMPFKEDDFSGVPMTIYSASKRAGEILGSTYNDLYGLNMTCFRFFTVYGPWGRPDMALFKFTKNMLAGEEIDVYNNGDMKRDFTYVDDIVDGFKKGLDKNFGFEIINLGHGKPVNLLDFIRILEKELEIEAKINFMPMQTGDVPETFADISKARELLGFEAKIPVEQGVKNFIDWYKVYYS